MRWRGRNMRKEMNLFGSVSRFNIERQKQIKQSKKYATQCNQIQGAGMLFACSLICVWFYDLHNLFDGRFARARASLRRPKEKHKKSFSDDRMSSWQTAKRHIAFLMRRRLKLIKWDQHALPGFVFLNRIRQELFFSFGRIRLRWKWLMSDEAKARLSNEIWRVKWGLLRGEEG